MSRHPRTEADGHKLLAGSFFTGYPAAPTTAERVYTDFILVSHDHDDHICGAVDITRRTGALVISDHGIVTWLGKQWRENVHSQHLGGGHKHPSGYLRLTLALNGSMLSDGSYGGNPCRFLLTTNDGWKIYTAQATGLFGDMWLIGEEGLDVAILPLGGNYTMEPTTPCGQ